MKTVKRIVLTSAIFLIAGLSATAQDANEILKKMDDVMYSPKDMSAKTRIILIDKNGNEKVRESVMIQKGNDKRLFRFTAPASQEGIATLSLPNDVMYLYLPSFGKERRISSSVKNQKFAGTDFTYDDMEAKPYVEKYTPELIGTEENVYILKLVPKSPKSQYSKLITKVDKNEYYPVFTEYYDKGNNKIKEATYDFVKIGKYWNAKEIAMKDLRKNHVTRMQMSDVKYDQGLSDDEFTVRNLKH